MIERAMMERTQNAFLIQFQFLAKKKKKKKKIGRAQT